MHSVSAGWLSALCVACPGTAAEQLARLQSSDKVISSDNAGLQSLQGLQVILFEMLLDD